MSYKKHHVKQKIRRIKPQRSILSYPIFWVGVLSIMFLGIWVYFFFFGTYFQVRSVQVSGADQSSNEKIQQEAMVQVKKNIVNSPFLSISSRNMYLFNTHQFQQAVSEQFPNIKEVSIQKKFPNIITVNLQQRVPLGVYCTTENNSFLIDDQGFLFAPFQNTSDQSFIIRKEGMDANLKVGEQALNASTMAAIEKVEKNLQEKFKISTKEFLIRSDEEMDVTTGEGWKIYFSIQNPSDLDLQIVKLSLLLSGDLSSEKRKNLQYIDLRFKDRAYYK